MTRKLTSWRPLELGLTAPGWDRLPNKRANPISSHKSMLSGLEQWWQQRRCVAQGFWTGWLDPQQFTGRRTVFIHFLPCSGVASSCERIIRIHVIAQLISGYWDPYSYRSLKYSAGKVRRNTCFYGGREKVSVREPFWRLFFFSPFFKAPSMSSFRRGWFSICYCRKYFVCSHWCKWFINSAIKYIFIQYFDYFSFK